MGVLDNRGLAMYHAKAVAPLQQQIKKGAFGSAELEADEKMKFAMFTNDKSF